MCVLFSLSDTALVQAYISGDDKAFHELVRRYEPDVQKVIRRYVDDTFLAEDLTQEAFIKIFVSLKSGRYKEEGKFLPWALRLTHNLCMDHLRKTAKNFRSAEFFPGLSTATEPIFLDHHARESQKASKLTVIINLLPQAQRKVLYYRHFEERSYKEIACLMNVSVSTTLARMRYGLTNLRKSVKADPTFTYR